MAHIKIGLDCGYGYTKAVSGTGSEIVFPSLAGHGAPLKRRQEKPSRPSLDALEVKISGEHWFVGDIARRHSRTCSYVFDREKAQNPETRALVATACALLTDGPEAEFDVVAGLPLDYYSRQKDSFCRFLETITAEVRFAGSMKKHISIRNALAFPQSAGAIVALSQLQIGKRHGLTGCIDIGSKTTDITVFEPDMEEIESLGATVDVGTHVLHDRISEHIEKQVPGATLSPPEIEYAVRSILSGVFENGRLLTVRGNQIDIQPAIDMGCFDIATNIKNEALKKWSHKIDSFSQTYLVGGGSKLVKSLLEDSFPGCQVPDQPQMLNARGFLVVARMMMGSMG